MASRNYWKLLPAISALLLTNLATDLAMAQGPALTVKAPVGVVSRRARRST